MLLLRRHLAGIAEFGQTGQRKWIGGRTYIYAIFKTRIRSVLEAR